MAAVLIGILLLAILGLGWQTFISGIAAGAQRVADNPLVDWAREYLQIFTRGTTELED
ncbi:MAG TPA: hypothetical protein VNI77_02605 [Nitrososphaera sp.]|nr:hypothetical protein [Nitrososphaera sp.]